MHCDNVADDLNSQLQSRRLSRSIKGSDKAKFVRHNDFFRISPIINQDQN